LVQAVPPAQKIELAAARHHPDRMTLTVTESEGRVCVQFGALARGEGASLQEAGDDLIRRLLELVLAVRSSGFAGSGEVRVDFEAMDLLYTLGEFAAAGGDIRTRIFG
jgi:hypothetical protein